MLDYKPAPALTEVSSILLLYFDVERSRTVPAVRVTDFHQLVRAVNSKQGRLTAAQHH